MVYGRSGGLAIYELLDCETETPPWVALYERGLAAYRSQDFTGAMALFRQVLAERDTDQPARIMLARSSAFLAAPPGKDWQATNAMKVK